MMRMWHIAPAGALALLLGTLGSAGVVAPFRQAQAAAVLSPAQQGWIHRIEASLAETKSFRARFEQRGSQDGGTSTGTVLLERPGRMRFSYDPPSPLLLVANEGRVVFQDRSIDQVTTIPLDHTPLGLLLRPDPRFSGDVTILGCVRQGNEIRLRVTRTENPGEGEMTLYFSSNPLALKGWTVLDGQGHKTVVQFSDMKTGIRIPAGAFALPREED